MGLTDLKNAIDLALQAGSRFMLMVRDVWSAFPPIVCGLIVMVFGIMVLAGIFKMFLY